MKAVKIFLTIALLLPFLSRNIYAQQMKNSPNLLDAKQQSIVSIAALTAKGDLALLQNAFADGLDAGLSVNQIKEVLIHLYAYAGFPRSLQGINTFMAVLETRKTKGIKDKVGKDATPAIKNISKYEQGKKALEALTGQQEKNPKTGYAAFAPVIDTFLKEHLFADVFGRDVLTYTEREIATVSALVSLGGVEPMMRSHIVITMRLGMTEAAMQQLLTIIEMKIGKEEADSGRRVLSTITSPTAAQNDGDSARNHPNVFAKGTKAPSTNFTGTAWVNMVAQAQDGLNASVGVVTFEPGARTAWHRHPGGQILLITEGKGYYQERGQPVRIMQKGDIVKCLPEIEHWHGASPDNSVTHIAIGPNTDKGSAVWLQKVTDQEYNNIRQQ